MRPTSYSLVVLAAVVSLTGCGGDPNARQAVSGTVTFNGQPLDQGRIHFVPVDKTKSDSGATVENGKYNIPRDVGLMPGTYKVSVYSYDQKGAKVQSSEIPGEPSAKQFKERIPAQYNVQTKLTAEVTA